MLESSALVKITAVVGRLVIIMSMATMSLQENNAHVAAVTMWITPSHVRPSGNLHTIIHLRGLPTGKRIYITIFPPPDRMGIVLSAQRQANHQGAVDASFTFAANDAGDYLIWAQLDTQSQPVAQAYLLVRFPITHSCSGKQPLPHIFGSGEQLLVQGKVVTPGSTVQLVGIGFAPCMHTAFDWQTMDGYNSSAGPPLYTDRYGDFHVVIRIPATAYSPRGYILAPFINGQWGPVVSIGVVRN